MRYAKTQRKLNFLFMKCEWLCNNTRVYPKASGTGCLERELQMVALCDYVQLYRYV